MNTYLYGESMDAQPRREPTSCNVSDPKWSFCAFRLIICARALLLSFPTKHRLTGGCRTYPGSCLLLPNASSAVRNNPLLPGACSYKRRQHKTNTGGVDPVFTWHHFWSWRSGFPMTIHLLTPFRDDIIIRQSSSLMS